MQSESGRKLELVLGAWFTAMTTGDPEPLARILHPDVIWNGYRPWQSCQGREQAMEFLGRNVTRHDGSPLCAPTNPGTMS